MYTIFEKDEYLRKELKNQIGRKEIFKFLKDTIENSQNILLIIDGEKRELPEITETYADTWGKIVKVAILKEYTSTNNRDSIYLLSPDFKNIEDIDIVTDSSTDEVSKQAYTEQYHLDGINEHTLTIYNTIKQKLIDKIPTLNFNSQRYYISLRKKRNFAFIKVRKKKITIVAMSKEEKIRERIKHHDVYKLSQGIQNFYNGACARINIEKNQNLDEIISLLVDIQK